MRQNNQPNEVAGLMENLPEQRREPLAHLTDDLRLLVVRHMPLAYAMAWRLREYGVSLDDLRQEGFLGLCEAARRYDERADCSFAAYDSYWCRKMMYLAIRQGKESTDDEPAHQQGEDDGGNIQRIGWQRRIDIAMGCLEQKEQTVIRHFYGLDAQQLSLSEIAKVMGICKARAGILHLRALKKLEAALTERPLTDSLAPWLG